MKAITRKTYGSPEVLALTEVPTPVPKASEVLVRNYATTVNRTDCGILTGKPFLIRFFTGLSKPRHLVTGTDFAGEIVTVGSAVKDLKVGDKVWGLNDEGLQSQAQYLTIDHNKCILPIPEGFSYEEIVACAEGAHYAYNFLNKLTLKANDKVLLNGSTGAIGSAALQILKSRDIYVTAVCNTKNRDLIKRLGADRIYDYEKEDFTEDKTKYDLIFDAVGKSRFPLCKQLLKEKGIYISSELGRGIENLYLPLLTLFSNKKVKFPLPNNPKRSLKHINELISKEQFGPVIDRRYKMAEIKEAYKYVMSGEKTGNVILTID